MTRSRSAALPLVGFLAAVILGIGAVLVFAPAAPATPHVKTPAEIARDACQPITMGGGMTICGTATLDPSTIEDRRDRSRMVPHRDEMPTRPVPSGAVK